MPGTLTLREMHADEVQTLVDWAKKEQWNPGTNDACMLYSSGKSYFVVGLVDDILVSSISASVYDSGYAFIGYYIVELENLRGCGYGMRAWEYMFRLLESKGIKKFGLDGAFDQIKNYEKSGFTSEYFHRRYCYEVSKNEARPRQVSLVPPSVGALAALDEQYVSESRQGFIRAWLSVDFEKKHASILDSEGVLVGYAALRAADKGYRVGPVYAQKVEDAIDLIKGLCAGLPENVAVYMDIPEKNPNMVRFIASLKLEPTGFDCMRMYKGGAPFIKIEEVYAVMTLEAG